MRKELTIDLIKEVLGPREGHEEIIEGNPSIEYITGVIVPKNTVSKNIIDLEEDKISGDPDSEITTEIGEDSIADDDNCDLDPKITIPTLISPKDKIKSFGLSFRVKNVIPSFRVCITWGRYEKIHEKTEKEQLVKEDYTTKTNQKKVNLKKDTKQSKTEKWKRKPFFKIIDIKMDSDQKEIVLYEQDDGNVILYARKYQSEKSDYPTIVLTLVNHLTCASEYPYTEHSLFQPYIRVNLEDSVMDTQMNSKPYSPGQELLEFLYKNNPVKARGHMCSVVWKEVDYSTFLEPEIYWCDGSFFKSECKDFYLPTLRSEFVPLHVITAPDFSWIDDENLPEFSSSKLAEMWDNQEIKKYLYPLILSYEQWIEKNKHIFTNLAQEDKLIVQKIIKMQEITLERIKSGYELLKSDKKAKNAFNFANKAIWLQNNWKDAKKSLSSKDFIWRPFQLAFILMNLEPISDDHSQYRECADLLWIPTGGGKTEAYLALMAFTMALRRLNVTTEDCTDSKYSLSGAGVCIITRYTLRLLTIQQFRRTLQMVTAAEYLRLSPVYNKIGWRAKNCDFNNDYLYGSARFTVGMWVGGAVSPNHLRGDIYAIAALQGSDKAEGEPAQVIRCPVCDNWLSIPKSGVPIGKNTIYIVTKTDLSSPQLENMIKTNLSTINSNLTDCEIIESVVSNDKHKSGFSTIKIVLNSSKKLREADIDKIWTEICDIVIIAGNNFTISSFRASRAGYFPIYGDIGRKNQKITDFRIYCTNPECSLDYNVQYREGVPLSIIPENNSNKRKIFPDGLEESILDVPYIYSEKIPIPAYTVDEQIYYRCPTILIGTVDKIARIAFEPRAASIFGNVNRYNAFYGYYRNEITLLPKVDITITASNESRNSICVNPFSPPDLIVQDELHLINGPLGSMFGLYEAVVDTLILENGGKPKYIASTATIKNAEQQINKLFARTFFQFPAYGLSVSDSFFIRNEEYCQGFDEDKPGRLYMGIYAPGKGAQTPQVRIWSRLLTSSQNFDTDPFCKYYWTIVGYYNAIREIGGGVALYREDIIERIRYLAQNSSKTPRDIDHNRIRELSSRINSTDIPQILSELEKGGSLPKERNPDAIFTTSMFGTGVDIPHLSLMIVNGQPKTTSQYIQATGRVGRTHGGLVVTFFKCGRPRDLSHYELFAAYHNRIHIDVEPASVSPYSSGALIRGAGPTLVGYLRNRPNPETNWWSDDATCINDIDPSQDVLEYIKSRMYTRTKRISSLKQIKRDKIANFFKSEYEKWNNNSEILRKNNSELRFVEYAIYRAPQHNVVLGDPVHQHNSDLIVIFRNAPQSLREIEETTSFEV